MRRLSNALVIMAVAVLLCVPACAISEFFNGDLKNGFTAVVMSFVLMGFAVFLEKFGKKK